MFICCSMAVLMIVLTFTVPTGDSIVGGREAEPHSRPYIVLVERTMYNNETRYCGGFLLSEYFVMTAASCQAKIFTIDQNGKIKKEKNYWLLQPVALSDGCDCSLPKSCSVSGWGLVRAGSYNMNPKLMEINVKLRVHKKCLEVNAYCSEGKDRPHGSVCEDGKVYRVVSTAGRAPIRLTTYAKMSDHVFLTEWISPHLKKMPLKKILSVALISLFNFFHHSE
uniref:Peptidase S1 domain-containing protein n=1 Tax=Nothobranchius furzeri TaxID=105023 RepID=A0A8C6M291_NOTFU